MSLAYQQSFIRIIKSPIALLIVSLLIPTSVYAKEITIKANDGFELSADYNAPALAAKKGVLMLHQCNEDKNMYAELGKLGAESGFHTLALDFRGYGKSVDETYSLKKMESKAADRSEYISKVRKMQSDHWPADVEVAYQYLSNKVGSNNIAFIGASCGGGQAMVLANRHRPTSFTFFSSGMNEEAVKRFVGLSEIPALFIAAQGDEYTFNSAKTAFEHAKNKQTRLLAYKGQGHGLPLFTQDKNLKNSMIDWFQIHMD